MTTRIDAEIESYHIARAMSWRYKLDSYEAASLQSILATYDAARAEILGQFQAKYATMSDWRSTRAEAVLGEVEAMTAGVRQTLSDQYGSMTVTAGSASLVEAASALSLGGLVSVNTVAMAPTQMRQFFQDMPICGHKLTEWVNASFSATVQEQMRQAINVGVLQGQGYGPIVKRLEEGIGMARNEATTLARTFVSAANNAARDEVYAANADVVKGWKWHTAGDNMVCMMCLPLHGQTFKMGKGPTMPRHPRCRCGRLPETISWRELGIDIDEFESEADKWIVRGKAGKDGTISVKPVGTGGANPILRISNHKDADAWWSNLSAAEKKATQLGPGRAELLDAGKIKMKDLIDKDYRVRTLNDLKVLSGSAQQKIERDLVLGETKTKLKFVSDEKVDIGNGVMANGSWYEHSSKIRVFIEKGAKNVERVVDNISYVRESIISKYPAWEKTAIVEHFKILDQANPFDPYWAKRYNYDRFVSAATGGSGQVNIYPAGANGEGLHATLRHELGHNYGGNFSKTSKHYPEGIWETITGREGFTSAYSKHTKSMSENFADSFKEMTGNSLAFKKAFPSKYQFIKEALSRGTPEELATFWEEVSRSGFARWRRIQDARRSG